MMMSPIQQKQVTQLKTIWDNQGLRYLLELLYSYNNGIPFSLKLNLYREGRQIQVGSASCFIEYPEVALLGDIKIFNYVAFDNIREKIYHLFHWFEPVNYRQRGLGKILLEEIIYFAKFNQVKRVQASLILRDLQQEFHLIEWFKNQGFEIELPTADEVESVIYRACLYLEEDPLTF